MEIEDFKKVLKEINELRDLLHLGQQSSISTGQIWELGKQYLIRTVTMTIAGRLKRLEDKELLLSDASWIADTGRFHDALKTGEFDEVEPFISDVIVGRGSIVDACSISFKEMTQK